MAEFIFYFFSTLLIGSAVAVIFSRNPVHSVLFLIFAFFNAAGLFILIGAEFLATLLVIVYVGAVAVLFLFVVMMMAISPDNQRSFFSKDRTYDAVATIGQFMMYVIVFGAVSIVLFSIAPVADEIQSGNRFTLDNLRIILQTSSWSVFSRKAPLAVSVISTIVTILVSRQATQMIMKTNFLSIISGFVDSLAFMILLGLGFMGIFTYMAFQWQTSPLSEDLVANATPPTDLVTNTQALGNIIYTDYILAFQACGILLLIAMIGAIVLTHRKREGVKKQDIVVQTSRMPADTLRTHSVPLGKGVDI